MVILTDMCKDTQKNVPGSIVGNNRRPGRRKTDIQRDHRKIMRCPGNSALEKKKKQKMGFPAVCYRQYIRCGMKGTRHRAELLGEITFIYISRMVYTQAHTCANIPYTLQEKKGFVLGVYTLTDVLTKMIWYLTGLSKCSKSHKKDRRGCHLKVLPQ